MLTANDLPLLYHVGFKSNFFVIDSRQNIFGWRAKDHIVQLIVAEHASQLPAVQDVLRVRDQHSRSVHYLKLKVLLSFANFTPKLRISI